MSAKRMVQLVSIGFLFSSCLMHTSFLTSKTFPALSPQKKIERMNKSEVNPMLKDLKPQLVWYYFDQISRIPRASSNEQALANYILKLASDNGLQGVQDKAGNVIVKKPASDQAYKNNSTLVLQSHLDMVTEKNKGIEHDFSKDPIQFVRAGKYLGAAGTTLGADNGIGVATMMALMSSDDLVHGPLELLFTVEEESGFGGARNVTAETITGRTLINLDTEEHGDIFVGCAGGCIVHGIMPLQTKQASEDCRFFQIVIDGLQGGHSGVDIHLGRGHALKMMAQFLDLLEEHEGYLASLNGGNKHNAIPRDAQAIVAIPMLYCASFAQAFYKQAELFKKNYPQEQGLKIELTIVSDALPVMSYENQEQLISFLTTVPQGVIKMSSDLEGLVETSTHLAAVQTTTDELKIITSQRSLIEVEKRKISQRIIDLLQASGMQATLISDYPGWKPNLASPVLQVTQATYQKLFNQKAAAKAIHAGLECGEIGEAIPGMDMVSFGPTIINAHSPSEQVDVESVPLFWKLLTTLLQDLAEQHLQKNKQVSKRPAVRI